MEEILLKLGFAKEPFECKRQYAKHIALRDDIILEIVVDQYGDPDQYAVRFSIRSDEYDDIDLIANYLQRTGDINSEVMQKYAQIAPLLSKNENCIPEINAANFACYCAIDSEIIAKEFEHFDELIDRIKEVVFELLNLIFAK